MVLVIDAGNSRIKAAVYFGNGKTETFSVSGNGNISEILHKETGRLLEKNGIKQNLIRDSVVCSVSPSFGETAADFCEGITGRKPFIIIPRDINGLRHRYKTIETVGADRIAAAAGASWKYPGKNLIVADFGTAVTIDAVDCEGFFLGGTIFPGAAALAESLKRKAPLLPEFRLEETDKVCGQSTEECLRAGLFYSFLGSVKEIVNRLKKECFDGRQVICLAGGGDAAYFINTGIFSALEEDLVLDGAFQLFVKYGGIR